jgi:hypothetical protein
MAAPDRTYPGTETGPPPLGLAWETPPPADVEVGQPITAVIRPTDEVLAVRYSYRRLQSDYWQTIPLPESSTMTALHWNTAGLTPGAYVLQVSIAADEGRNVTTSAYFQVSGAVTYSLDEQTIADMSDEELRDSLNAVRDRIRQLERDSAVEERAAENEAARQRILERQLEEAIRRQEEQDSILQAHRLIFARLREIDRRLERVEDAYGERVDSLVQALRRAGQAATPPDLDGLKGALAAAEANLRICEEQRRDLQNQIDAVRAQIDSRHEAVLAVAKEVTDMMTRHGWTAGYHEWPDGRVGFGGVGDEAHTLRRGHPDYEPFWELFYKGKDLNKEIRKLNQQLDGLEANLRSLDDCRRQAEAVEAARRALETGRTARQQRNELDQICEEINMLLGTLQSFCGEHPGICTAALLARLEALLEACPSPEAWDAFFRQLEGAVAVKAGIEEGYGRRVSTDSTRAAEAAETVDRLRKELAASANAEASRRDRAAAHRDALARARAARRAMEAEEAARREIRNRPKPVTPYPEPVPFSDTELKGTAHAALLRLADKVARVDAVIKHGTDCTCELNALRAADIAIVQQVLGKLGVEVMFAPLSALPAGKGAKLGMSLLKDFASSVFGGGNLTEDATKTLLKFAGGEVFGKLLDSEFFGEQAAGLSVEAANRLLKSMAGDLQAFSWDGDVQVQCRHPDERWISLNVSVNGLYNEATGWAVLRIETDDPDCKGYLVKFRVDEEGVLIGDSVRTQELP